MKRRAFLKVLGGGGMILAAGAAGFLTTRSPSTALDPWDDAGVKYGDPMRKALSFALLAPNPHNRQPWMVELLSDDEAMLYCDLERRLPHTDPFDRQISIGLGCFLELWSVAASHFGYRADIKLFPEGTPLANEDGRLDERPVAHMKLIKSETPSPDPLFAHCLARRTDRGAYDPDRKPSDNDQREMILAGQEAFAASGPDAMSGVIEFIDHGPALEAARSITIDGMMAEAYYHDAHMESVNLMRIGVKEVDLNPDGISLYGPMLDSLASVGVLNRDALADTESAIFKQGVEPVLEAARTTPAFVWISSEGNDRVDQIAAGRAYMRICLASTGKGLAMQPVSQALQEYEDMAPHFKRLHDLLAKTSDSRVQMFARIGYGSTLPPSPRWPLSNRLRG